MPDMRLVVSVVFIVLLVWAMIGVAGAGDATLGRPLAQKLCVNCHIVEPDGSAAVVNEAIPTFMAIARKPDQSESRIRGFILNPHPLMPDVQLTAQELDNIAAYIISLKEE